MDNFSHSPHEHISVAEHSYSTPKKLTAHSEPFLQYLTPYFSSKLKEIASKIRSSAKKRFRMRQADGEMKLVFWSELKQVSESTSTKTSLASTEKELNVYEMDQLIKKNRNEMLKMVSSNIQKRKSVEQLIKKLSGLVIRNRKEKVQLKSLTKINKDTRQMTSYGLFLMQVDANQHLIISKIKKEIALALEERNRITNCNGQIQIIDNLIQQKTLRYEHIDAQQNQCTNKIQRLVDEITPNSMINCMFLVGLLSQQVYIHILQRKEKMKQTQGQKPAHKTNKISQKLGRREIHINCHKSEIVEFSTFTAIYMHCKSLTIASIVNLMNSLSFFDVEFKQIYNYHLFEEFIRNLVEFRYMNQTKKHTAEFNQAQTIKKGLIIFVSHEHEPLLRWILRIFERQGSKYYICLSTMRMMIEVAVQSDQPSKGEQRELPSSQSNQLRLYFHSLPCSD